MSDREAAAAAVRRLGHALMERDVDAQLLRRVADELGALADEAAAAPRRRRDVPLLTERMFASEVADGETVVHFDECVVSGPWNPLGIGIEVVRDGEEAVATVRLGAAFEGGPGMAHGGIVAALFDDVLGYLLTLHRIPAFTGELTVRYHRPTPVGEELELRARVLGREGQRLQTAAEARAAGTLVASATAIFVGIDAAALAADRR